MTLELIMDSKRITISAPSGLHARPAGELVKLVKTYSPTTVKLTTATKSVNAASMLSVLSLGLKCGSQVEVSAEGEREEEALCAVADFLEKVME